MNVAITLLALSIAFIVAAIVEGARIGWRHFCSDYQTSARAILADMVFAYGCRTAIRIIFHDKSKEGQQLGRVVLDALKSRAAYLSEATQNLAAGQRE